MIKETLELELIVKLVHIYTCKHKREGLEDSSKALRLREVIMSFSHDIHDMILILSAKLRL